MCGDRASGYHYNALTCEGCKGESRRQKDVCVPDDQVLESKLYQFNEKFPGGSWSVDEYR